MKTWQIVLQLMRWRPVVYGFLLLFSIIVFGLPLVVGVLMQSLFDTLSGPASSGLGLWDILALLVACQEVVDIAYHVVADEGWGVPTSHSDAFESLAQHSVITTETAEAISKVARARNRIAHGYASIDHARLWTELPDGLVTLERFSREVAAWLPAA